MLNRLKKIIPTGIKFKILKIINKREIYTCPFCGNISSDFKSIGLNIPVLIERKVVGAGIRNGGCFKCGSSDRERLVYVFLKYKWKIFNKSKKLKLLHFAPEFNLSRKLAEFKFKEYLCGDLFTEGYNYPEHVKNMNVLDIPYKENSFDIIICNHLLEHVPNDIDAMRELFRVLKIEGKAILQVPISQNSAKTLEDFSITEPSQREIIFGQADHVRIYGQDYLERLSSVGFQVKRINISKKFKKYGLNMKEDLFTVEKRRDFRPKVAVNDLNSNFLDIKKC